MNILIFLRRFLSDYWVTSNTIRYRIELRALLSCIDHIPMSERQGVLADLGAGSGEMSRRLFKQGNWKQLIGIEYDDSNFKTLINNYSNLSYAISKQGSLLDLPLESCSVDWVLSTQVLEHITDHQKAVSEIHRILKPGGYALISVPHPPEIFPNPGHVRPGYSEDQLKDLFNSCQFSFLGSRYFFIIKTLRRIAAVEEFPILRFLCTLSEIDCEKALSENEIKSSQPYGIVVLFKKT